MIERTKFFLYVFLLSILVILLIGCSGTEEKLPESYNVYIPNSGEGTISIIDSTSREMEQILSVGETASHGVAVTLDNKYLFTGDLDAGNIYVVDTEINEITKTIQVGERVHGIDMSPDGKYVLVAAGRGGGPFLAVIDAQQQEVAAVIEENLVGPTHISFSPDGKRAYVADPEQDAVVVVDMINLKTEAVWNTGSKGAQETRTSPDGKLLYVANYEGNSLSVIDTADGSLLKIIPAGEKTHAVDVSPDGKYVWVVASESSEVLVMDSDAQYKITRRLKLNSPNHVSFSPDGSEVYITDTGESLLLIYDPDNYKQVAQVPLGKSPHEIDFVLKSEKLTTAAPDKNPGMDINIDDYTRSDSQGGVVVDAVWSTFSLYEALGNQDLIQEYEINKYQVFDLMMTTHSGDLRDYAYLENTTLVIDRSVEIKPEKVDVLSNDSHHPQVLLKFPLKDSQGKEYLSGAGTMELILKDLRNIHERSFVWELVAINRK